MLVNILQQYLGTTYLASSSVIVTSLADTSDLLVHCEFPLFWKQNAGLDGAWRGTVLLLSMVFTVDIMGLSAGLCWTHRSPIWMHFNIWSTLGWSLKDESIISRTVPMVQCPHTCIRQQIQNLAPKSPLQLARNCNMEFVIMTYALTKLRRWSCCSESYEPPFLLPATISNIKTPKLNTSDLIE